MDTETREFLEICDATMAETERVQESIRRGELHPALLVHANILAEKLQVLRRHVEEGTLRRPSGGIGFGMGRAVEEWAYDLPLMDLVWKLEDFYMGRM